MYTVGFKPLTVLKLAKQLLQRLHTLSIYNIVHGDIQPGNMLLGIIIYIVLLISALIYHLTSSKFPPYFRLNFGLFSAYY